MITRQLPYRRRQGGFSFLYRPPTSSPASFFHVLVGDAQDFGGLMVNTLFFVGHNRFPLGICPAGGNGVNQEQKSTGQPVKLPVARLQAGKSPAFFFHLLQSPAGAEKGRAIHLPGGLVSQPGGDPADTNTDP